MIISSKVVFTLAVSGLFHAVRFEIISQANEVLLIGSPNALASTVYSPWGESLLVSVGGRVRFLLVCETLSSIPLGTLFGA